MALIKDILRSIYGDIADVLMEYNKVTKCIDYIPCNCAKVAGMIYKVLMSGGNVVIHADIDTDGFGSAYILKKFISAVSNKVNMVTLANTVKQHGITDICIEYINENSESVDLVVIVDSSTNEIEAIKKIKANTVVIDHHEVLVNTDELCGDTAGGKYAICTNMLGTEEESKLSGCAVVYYVIKYICDVIKFDLESLHLNLEQWVGLTLISDVIRLDTMRGQYFIERLYRDSQVELSIRAMMQALRINKVDKNLIGYKIAPLINSAIRCGASLQALDIVMCNAQNIGELMKYKEYQSQAVKFISGYGQSVESEGLVYMNVRGLCIPDNLVRNYCGVIASSLCKKYGKSAYVFVDDGDMYKGSFRGASNSEDYRTICENAGFRAMGHKAAFGLDVKISSITELEKIMSGFKFKFDRFISVGQVNGGIYHIDSLEQLKKDGNMMLLAVANSRLSSNETLELHAKLDSLEYTTRGKARIYILDGFELLSFEELDDTNVRIYPEFSNYGVSLYTNKV